MLLQVIFWHKELILINALSDELSVCIGFWFYVPSTTSRTGTMKVLPPSQELLDSSNKIWMSSLLTTTSSCRPCLSLLYFSWVESLALPAMWVQNLYCPPPPYADSYILNVRYHHVDHITLYYLLTRLYFCLGRQYCTAWFCLIAFREDKLK